MERTDWLDKRFDAEESRFLMLTAITHHRFESGLWAPDEVAKLAAELRQIDAEIESISASTGWSLSPTRVDAGHRAA